MTHPIILALDFSLRSPGICVMKDGFYHLFGFAKIGCKFQGPLCDVTVLKYDDTGSDLVRYRRLIESVFTTCIEPVTATPDIVLEGYAFVPGRGGSNYKIHEVTGILKWELFKRFGVEPVIWNARQWRKILFGGGGDKLTALEHFEKKFPETDLFDICNRKRTDSVVSPVQDICEALCICDARLKYLNSPEDFALGKKRKRKRPA